MRREIAPKSEDMKHPKSRPSSRPSRPRGPSGYGPRKKPPATTSWPGGTPPRVTSVLISPSTPRVTHTVSSIVRTRVGRRASGVARARASVGACGVDSPFTQSPQNTAVQRRQLCSLKILRIFSRVYRRGKWGSATLFWVQSIRLPSRNTFVGARTDRTPVLNARTQHSRRRRDVDTRRGSRAPHRESRTAGRIDTNPAADPSSRRRIGRESYRGGGIHSPPRFSKSHRHPRAEARWAAMMYALPSYVWRVRKARAAMGKKERNRHR